MGVGQLRGPQVSVLGLRAIIGREDVAQGAPLRCANQCAAFAGDFARGSQVLPGQSQAFVSIFAVGLAALGKLAYDAATLVTVFWDPDFGLLFECNDGLMDLEAF